MMKPHQWVHQRNSRDTQNKLGERKCRPLSLSPDVSCMAWPGFEPQFPSPRGDILPLGHWAERHVGFLKGTEPVSLVTDSTFLPGYWSRSRPNLSCEHGSCRKRNQASCDDDDDDERSVEDSLHVLSELANASWSVVSLIVCQWGLTQYDKLKRIRIPSQGCSLPLTAGTSSITFPTKHKLVRDIIIYKSDAVSFWERKEKQ